MSNKISKEDREDFAAYLRNSTNGQLQGVYDKEKAANRHVYANLAVAEAQRRNITLNR